jgi:hypothetical protein
MLLPPFSSSDLLKGRNLQTTLTLLDIVLVTMQDGAQNCSYGTLIGKMREPCARRYVSQRRLLHKRKCFLFAPLEIQPERDAKRESNPSGVVEEISKGSNALKPQPTNQFHLQQKFLRCNSRSLAHAFLGRMGDGPTDSCLLVWRALVRDLIRSL